MPVTCKSSPYDIYYVYPTTLVMYLSMLSQSRPLDLNYLNHVASATAYSTRHVSSCCRRHGDSVPDIGEVWASGLSKASRRYLPSLLGTTPGFLLGPGPGIPRNLPGPTTWIDCRANERVQSPLISLVERCDGATPPETGRSRRLESLDNAAKNRTSTSRRYRPAGNKSQIYCRHRARRQGNIAEGP